MKKLFTGRLTAERLRLGEAPDEGAEHESQGDLGM